MASTTDRAQSESIGVILLVGVVVVTVGGSSAVILGLGGGGGAGGSAAPLADLGIDATTANLSVEHRGGDAVAMADAVVIVRDSAGETRYQIDAANVTGDGDDRFEPGERFERAHGISGDRATILVVDTAENEVLARATVDVTIPDGNREPTARFTTSPDTPDPGATVTLDARSASDPDGSITSYEWDLGDGATATGQTVTHSYASAGRYTVEVTVTDDSGATDTTTRTVWVTTARSPDGPSDVVPGVTAEYYEGTYTSLPAFGSATPKRVSNVSTFDISGRDRGDNVAYRFTGYVNVTETGTYTFYTDSDDGSRLYVGGQRVVDNGGLHPATEASGTIDLQPGYHNVTVTYFEHTGVEVLDVRWAGPSFGKRSITAANLSRESTPLAEFAPSCGGLSCSFDASGSSATGSATITSYEWAFGDGTTTTTTGPTVSHTYASESDYDVTLTVVDDAGNETTVTRTASATDPNPPANPSDTTSGLAYSYYEAGTVDALSDLQSSAIVRNGTTDQFDLDPAHRGDNYGFRFTGYVEVPQTGEYTFYTTSDDGSRLFVDGERVVNNDGLHSSTTQSGEVALEAGKHPITVTMFEHTGFEDLSVEYEGPGVGRQVIPASALSRDRQQVRWASTADWDGSVSAESVVHDSFGDHTSDTVGLGTPPFDRGGSNLVAYWPLDEDAGTTATDVAGDNDGTARGDVTPGRPGIAGTTGYDFGGTDGRVRVTDDPSLPDDALTVSLWVRTKNFSDSGQTLLFAQNDFDGRQGVTVLDDGGFQEKVIFRILGGGSYYDVNVSRGRVNDGDWHHITGTHDGGETVLYLDGQRVDSRTDATFDPAPVDLGIGAGASGYGPLEGDMDEVRFYNRSLSDSEVERLYNASRQGSLTTGTKSLQRTVSPADLTLRNVSAVRPAGTAVTVTVRSDPDGDGTFEEVSDSITLDGSASYDVTGLASDSRRFRLSVDLSTTDPTASATVDRLELAG